MLTKSTIDQAKPASGVTVLWDDALPGFGCRVHPTGKRSFVVKYRLAGDRKVIWSTLGAYGVLTVAEARTKAREVLKDARLGADPQGERKSRAEAAAALTVGELVARYTAALKAGTVSTKRLRGPRAAAG